MAISVDAILDYMNGLKERRKELLAMLEKRKRQKKFINEEIKRLTKEIKNIDAELKNYRQNLKGMVRK